MLCVSCYLSSARVRPVLRISLDENGAVMAVSVQCGSDPAPWCRLGLAGGRSQHGHCSGNWGYTGCSTGLGMLGSLLVTPRSSLFPSLGSRLLTKK